MCVCSRTCNGMRAACPDISYESIVPSTSMLLLRNNHLEDAPVVMHLPQHAQFAIAEHRGEDVEALEVGFSVVSGCDGGKLWEAGDVCNQLCVREHRFQKKSSERLESRHTIQQAISSAVGAVGLSIRGGQEGVSGKRVDYVLLRRLPCARHTPSNPAAEAHRDSPSSSSVRSSSFHRHSLPSIHA